MEGDESEDSGCFSRAGMDLACAGLEGADSVKDIADEPLCEGDFAGREDVLEAGASPKSASSSASLNRLLAICVESL